MSDSSRFELLIATRNLGKIAELRQAFANLPLALRFLSEFENISEAKELGNTYEENALLKAISYARQTGIAALTDDSGLEVDALQGQPGVLSARFAGSALSDSERTQALLTLLSSVRSTQRTARFVCCMVLYGSLPFPRTDLSEPRVLAVTNGVCEGSLATKPMGTEGFGFDPIFIPNGYDLSFSALVPAIKRKISHRARAAELMRQRIQKLLGPSLTTGGTAS